MRAFAFALHTLAIIIPAYNEEARLARTLQSIADAWTTGAITEIELKQVIVVDDGSTDHTFGIACEWKKSLPIHVVRFPRNRGKGAAVRAGVKQADAESILMFDADGAAPILEIRKLLPSILSGRADIAIGSRVFEGGGSLVTMAPHRRFIGRAYHALCSSLVPGIRDTACGCKLFKADVAKHLFSLQTIDRFAFDVEVLALALRLHYRVVEVPLKWTAIPESKVRLFRDGIEMFWCLIRLYITR